MPITPLESILVLFIIGFVFLGLTKLEQALTGRVTECKQHKWQVKEGQHKCTECGYKANFESRNNNPNTEE
jgi:hypothetical protein